MSTLTDIPIQAVAHLSEVLQEATRAHTPVMPVGGGTCLTTGYPVDHTPVRLDLSGLSGVVEYVPTDMTASFLAGTSVATVREALAENGQELPLDLVADDAGTIGGLVATGFAGPRRFAQGTLKDLLIGCEYVRGDGLVAKAGGMTVKNVSGFEITRMLHGSWGSLAVLTCVNLKVIPMPRVDRTLIWHDADAIAATERQFGLLAAFPGAAAMITVQRENHWQTAIRFQGRESAVDDYVRQCADLEGTPETQTENADIWIARLATAEKSQLVLSGTTEAVRASLSTLLAAEAVTDVAFSLATGTLRATFNQQIDLAPVLSSLPTPLWMIEGGPDTWKRGLPIWGPPRPDSPVMQSIKQQFDPAGILNRGRLFI